MSYRLELLNIINIYKILKKNWIAENEILVLIEKANKKLLKTSIRTNCKFVFNATSNVMSLRK